MIFGDPTSFAIEAIVENELSAPSAVWGRMRIWCQGETIGDFNEPYCGLYPAYIGFKDLQITLPTLSWTGIEKMTNTEIWNFLDGLLYGYHGDKEIQDNRPLEQMQKDTDIYGKFNFLTNWGEQFDFGGKSFIFCRNDHEVTILNRSLPTKYNMALITTNQSLNSAISSFLSWFQDQALRLSGERNIF
jgi:hypothetical protein